MLEEEYQPLMLKVNKKSMPIPLIYWYNLLVHLHNRPDVM